LVPLAPAVRMEKFLIDAFQRVCCADHRDGHHPKHLPALPRVRLRSSWYCATHYLTAFRDARFGWPLSLGQFSM
jgi:hypothetical protein